MRPITQPQHHATHPPRTISAWRSATCYLLFLLVLTACGADHHARQVIAAYKTALQNNDLAAYARIGSPNMRACIDEHDFSKDDTLWAIDALMKHVVRTIRTPHAVVYLGWVPHFGVDTLYPLLVGEGTALRQFGRLHADAPPESEEWQVSMIYSNTSAIVDTSSPGEPPPVIKEGLAKAKRAAVEAALAKIDDQLFTTWLLEGNNDAKKAIKSQLPFTQ